MDDDEANAALTLHLEVMLAHLQNVVAPVLAEREAARLEAERIEAARIAAEKAEQARVEAERKAAAAEKARAEKERKAAERAAKAEQAAAEQAAIEAAAAEQQRIADEAEQLRAKQTASGIAGLPFGLTKGQAKYRLRQILIGDARLSRTELAAGIALADLYDAQDQRRIYTWCSNENLAEWIGTTERNVIRATKRLGDLEYFTKESGWRGHSSRYFPNWDLLNKRVAGDTETEVRVTATVAKGDVHVTDRVTHMSPHTVQYRSHSVGIVEVTPAADAAGPGGPSAAAGAPGEKRTARNKRDGGSTSAGASAPEGFTEFWSVYPKQEGLLAAQSEYKRQLAKGVSPGLLLDAAKRYALAKADTDARWLKFPVTWLREQKYLENPQPPKPRAEKSAAPKREAKRKGKTTSKKKARAKIKGDTRVLGVAWHEDWGKVALLSRVTSSPVRVVTRHGVRRDTPAGLLSQFDMRAMRFDDVVRWLD